MPPRALPDGWSRRQIERKLVADVAEAQRRFDEAKRRLNGQIDQDALANLNKARSRWHEFVLRGTIPEDLGHE